jgi:signal transduction histidine kinase
MANLYLTQWQHDSAVYYLNKSEDIIRNERPGDYVLAEIYSLWGSYYSNMLEFKKSKEFFTKMCDLAKAGKDSYHRIKCELDLAELDYRKGDFSEALLHGFEALNATKTYEYPPQLADVYLKLGSIYSGLAQHDLASKYYYESLKISERLRLRRKVAEAYSSLSWIYYQRKALGQAMNFIERSQSIREEIGDIRGIGNCHNVKGLIYYVQNQYDRSLVEFDVAQKVWASIGHEEGVSASLFNKSLIFIARQQPEEALHLQLTSIEVDLKSGNKYSLAVSYNAMASLQIKMGRLGEATSNLNKAHELAVDIGSRQLLMDNNYALAQLFKSRGDYKKAFEYMELYRELSDSVYSKSSAVKLAEMQALHQVEQKDREIQALNKQKELNEKEIALQSARINQQYVIVFASVIGLALSMTFGIVVYRYNSRVRRANKSILEQKEEIVAQSEELMEANEALVNMNREISEQKEEIQAQSEELTEANEAIYRTNLSLEESVTKRTTQLRQAYQELDTFFYRSSHDFRRPITTFLGLAEVAKVTVRDRGALELFDKVRVTASQLDKMLFKLQSVSDLGSQQLIHKEVFLKELAEEIVNNHREALSGKGITVNLDVEVNSPFFSYPAMVKIIMENLFENAIEFSNVENPYVKLGVHSNLSDMVIHIEDNGQGIDMEYQSRIFDMYFRANERSKGSGLGLYIVKKAVERLAGDISFKSEKYKGSRFIVRLPSNHKKSD